MKYAQLLKAIDATSQHLLARAASAVNQALVVRNWLIGAYIVEFEQHGEDRAKYGTKLLARLASDLKERRLKGLSVQMLERTRQFYMAYPQVGTKISSSLLRKFSPVQESEVPSRGKTQSAKTRIPQPPVAESGGVTPLPAEAVLCLSWTNLKVEFATAGMDNKLFVSRYLVALPSAKQLEEFIERDREQIEAHMTKGRAS